MALVVTDDSHYKAIANTLRERLDDEEFTCTPEEMAGGVSTACEVSFVSGWEGGKEEGFSEGYSVGRAEGHEDGFTEGRETGFNEGFDSGLVVGKADGIEQGKQAEYDRFWDAYQQNGTLTNYERCFAGRGWTAENFKPKYDIVPVTITQMFSAAALPNCDLDELAAKAGVSIDFSKATTFTEPFLWGVVVKVGTIDTRSAENLQTIFGYAYKLKTIRLLILKDDGSQLFGNNSFNYCNELVDLTIQGVIGTTGANLQWSTKLSKDSITSVVNALSSTTSGLSITLSKTAVNNAFTTAEWNTLAGTKTNWTINLV